MKDKITGFLKSKIFFSIVLNLIIAVFCALVTSFHYDTMDDFYNSMYISHYHYYYSNDINYILCILIGSLQFILGRFNCFVLALVGLSLTSFVSITYVFSDKYSKPVATVFSVIINILFALNHYSAVNSSKTSALLLAAGFLLILNAIRNKRYNLPCWIGVCEILLGSFFNYYYFFIAFGFAFAYFLADMIAKRKYKIAFRKFFWYFRPFLLMFAFVFMLTLGLNQYSISVNTATEETANYYEYCNLTDAINNYPYPDYKEYADEFSAVGLDSEDEYELLKNSYYDSNTSLNNTTLQVVSDIQQRTNNKNVLVEFGNVFVDIWRHIITFDSTALVMICLLILATIYIIYQKRRFCFFPIFIIIIAIASSTVLRYFFMAQDYLTYGIWLLMFVMILNAFDFEQKRPLKHKELFELNLSKRIISGIAVLLLFVGSGFVYAAHLNEIDMSDKPVGLYLAIKKHPERYFVLDPNTATEYMTYTDNYVHPLWGFSSSFLDNIDTFGAFQRIDDRRKHNLNDNVYEAAVESKYVFIIDNSITFRKENYFTKYYSIENEPIVYSQAEEISGYKIYKIYTD